jgi:hypothetical protein
VKIFPTGVSFEFVTSLTKEAAMKTLKENTSSKSKLAGFPDADYWGDMHHSTFDITPVPRYTREPPPVFHCELGKAGRQLVVFVKVSALFPGAVVTGFWVGSVGAIALGVKMSLENGVVASAELQVGLIGVAFAAAALLVAHLYWRRVGACKRWLLRLLEGKEHMGGKIRSVSDREL